MAEQAVRGTQWGTDLAFTFGPTSVLATGYYSDLFAYLDLGVGIFISLSFALCLWALILSAAGRRTDSNALLSVLLTLAVALAFALCSLRDTQAYALAVATFLAFIRVRNGSRLLIIAAICGAAALGPLAIAKTSYATVAVYLLIFADFDALLRRRLPLATPTLLASTLIAYLLMGQSLSALPRFVSMQGAVAAGYSEAMSLPSNLVEIACFLCLGLLSGCVVLLAERRQLIDNGRARRAIALTVRAAAMGGFGFIIWKASFVRHDVIHALVGWQVVGAALTIYSVSIPWRRGVAALGATALSLGLITMTVLAPARWAIAASPQDPVRGYSGFLTSMLDAGPRQHYGELVSYLRDPADWHRKADRAKEEAWARVRQTLPLPALSGTIDTVPSNQVALLAHGLNYRPRPVFQEYTTYTAHLIEANRAFFAGARAPEWLLLKPETLDERYPALTEGPLWPDFLRSYRPADRAGDLALLRRRPEPLPNLLGTPRAMTLRLDTPLPIEPEAPLFAQLRVRLTLIGQALNMFYRPPIITIRVRFRDGTERGFRLIRQIAAKGFVLSPMIASSDDYLSLARGEPTADPAKVVGAITVEAGPLGTWAYDPQVAVTLRPIQMDVLKAGR
jgi:hypothetical protein